ncbi:MAG: GPP34 family phosphoprotein [Victivallaceae bacterium]|nr:GPP34 family phosphoprotein [Victivallaceae bacterium]
MLSFAEEIYLLALNEDTGKVTAEARDPVLGTVIIGAVLTELSFLKKISTAKERLYILDTEPTKHLILNEVLDIFRESKKTEATIERVLEVLMPHAKRLEELVLAELIRKGILKEIDKKILWIFPDRRYPLINNKEIVSVEIRLRKLLLEGGKPDPKDAALISLLRSSELFSKILSPDELERCEKHIAELSEMCDIGQKIDELVYKIKDFADYPFI